MGVRYRDERESVKQEWALPGPVMDVCNALRSIINSSL